MTTIGDILRPLLEPVRKNGVLTVEAALRKGRISTRAVNGRSVRWLITNRNDEIQSRQLEQGYYELDELQQLKGDLGSCPTVLDVGANIGNHAVFFCQHMGCRKLTLVEPYWPALSHLLVNLALNDLEGVEGGFLPFALGATSSKAAIVPPTRFNIGLTRLDLDRAGDIRVVKGDEVMSGEPLDLIKIDVEGMELAVLAGLSEVLTRDRPAIYVEVDRLHRAAFLQLLKKFRYRVVRESSAYGSQSNFTAVASEG